MTDIQHEIDDSEHCEWCGNFACCIEAYHHGGVRADGKLYCNGMCLAARY